MCTKKTLRDLIKYLCENQYSWWDQEFAIAFFFSIPYFGSRTHAP
jgi:hypothetical protein